MADEFKNDHDAITTLVAEFRAFKEQNTKDITDLKNGITNLQQNFVPRSEFSELSMVVKGVANEGGLVKKVADMETWQNKVIGGLILLNIVLGFVVAYYSSH